MALIGSLLLCLARVFNQSDRQIQNRALLVRKLATWVALGWLLLIPLQLFLGVRLINSQSSSELEQIQAFERVAKAVRDANSELELRQAMAQEPPFPPHGAPAGGQGQSAGPVLENDQHGQEQPGPGKLQPVTDLAERSLPKLYPEPPSRPGFPGSRQASAC